MTRSLRRRHLLIAYWLGVLLPLTFAAGVAARQRVPVIRNALPDPIQSSRNPGEVVWSRSDLWPGQRVITVVTRNTDGTLGVTFSGGDLVTADPLLYWVTGKEAPGAQLPNQARLLGAYSAGVTLPIPPGVRGEDGRFVLYSLATQEIVASSEWMAANREPKGKAGSWP